MFLVPRKPRLEYEGAVYHVMNRGDHREPIFLDDSDYELFLKTLDETCQKTGFQIHAYCLMPNHFHLVVETPGANLVAGMRWLLSTYTARFNRRRKFFGHLFSGRYKAMIVDGSSGGYLRRVCNYVHLNPVRAGLVRAGQPLWAFRWSSYPAYLRPARQRPSWLRVERLLGELNLTKDNPRSRLVMQEYMEKWRTQEADLEYKGLGRGWFFGDNALKEQLLEKLGRQESRPSYQGEPGKQSAEQQAHRLVAEALKKQGWTEDHLTRRPKGDPIKIKIAAELRSRTTMTRAWVVQRLNMGTVTHLAHLLYWRDRKKK